MQFREAVRATRQWAPFAAKTVAFGSMSLLLGPLTRDRRASLYAMQRWCRSSVRGLDIEVRVSGLENVPDGVPVVPVAIEGTHKLMKKGAFDTGDGTMRIVHLKIGKPVRPVAGKERQTVPDLRHRTHTAMCDLVRSIGGKVGDVDTSSGYAD